jgi:hypothetical protein
MKVTIELLRFEHGEQRVVGAITHETHAIESVAAAAQGVIDCDELSKPVDGYRIVTEGGAEYYGWPGRGQATDMREG